MKHLIKILEMFRVKIYGCLSEIFKNNFSGMSNRTYVCIVISITFMTTNCNI